MVLLNKQLIKEIAAAPAEEIGLGIFRGIQRGNGKGRNVTAEAHAEPRFIVLEPNFFEHDVESRERILIHEIGHYWADDFIDYLLKNKNNEFQKIFSGDLDSPLVLRRVGNKVEWIYGHTRNVLEALADAFASYHSNKENKKFLQEKYPAAYKYLLPYFTMKFECPVDGVFTTENSAARRGKQTVIFIHGLFSSVEMHRVLPLVNSMKTAGFNVVVPELVGHGKMKGEKADAFNLRESMDAIAVLIRKQKKRVVLVGHSMGGAIALSLGINLRAHVKAVFAIAAPNGRHSTRKERLAKLSKLFGFDVLSLDNDKFGQILQVMPLVNYKQQTRLPKTYLIHSKIDSVVPFKEFEENKSMLNVPDERTVVYESISNIGEWDHWLSAYHPRTLKFINQNVKELSKT